MEKIVQYDSKMNELSFGKLKEKELDLFFSICYRMKNEGINEVVLSFQELKELSNYSNRNLDRFMKDLQGVYKKLLNITMEFETETKIIGFVLFTWYEIHKENRTVTIRVNDKYGYVLNDISKFTKFDLIEFVNLKSSYAKNMFKLLKQYDNEDKYNWYQIKLDNLKTLLDIPKSYKMSHIDSFVLAPILEQLKPCFKGLNLEKIKKGVKVDSLKFTWYKSKKNKDVIEMEVIKKRKSIGEKELAEHEQIVKQEANKELKKDENKIELVKKINITKSEYEELYKEYLKEIKQESNPTNKRIFDIMNKIKYTIIELETEKINIKKYTIDDIPEEKLLSKTGKKLVGMIRINRIEKILAEMNG
ncbi:MAG: replication initiation protein [Cetobacterium sp.]